MTSGGETLIFGKRPSCSVSARASSSEKAARCGGAPETGKSRRVGISGRARSSDGAVDGEVDPTGFSEVSEEEVRADFSEVSEEEIRADFSEVSEEGLGSGLGAMTGIAEGGLLSCLCSVVPKGVLARRESCWRATSCLEGVPATTSRGESNKE